MSFRPSNITHGFLEPHRAVIRAGEEIREAAGSALSPEGRANTIVRGQRAQAIFDSQKLKPRFSLKGKLLGVLPETSNMYNVLDG